jgi:shikimate dehydrogenase
MINGGVLGSPIAHSLSPVLHNLAYDLIGKKASYKAFEVASGGLTKFLSSDGADLNSVSLTMPLKIEALVIADHVSAISNQISSGNTLHNISGQWHLTSTDVEGFTFALAEHGQRAKGNVLIIGAGATARAVAAACDQISNSLTVINRTPSREAMMMASAPNSLVSFVDWNTQINFASFDLVVNTTPGDSASIFIGKVSKPSSILFEVLYHPWPTPLLAHWRENGGYGIDGLDLLIHQAISQIQIFTGQSIDRASMAKELRRAGLAALH